MVWGTGHCPSPRRPGPRVRAKETRAWCLALRPGAEEEESRARPGSRSPVRKPHSRAPGRPRTSDAEGPAPGGPQRQRQHGLPPAGGLVGCDPRALCPFQAPAAVTAQLLSLQLGRQRLGSRRPGKMGALPKATLRPAARPAPPAGACPSPEPSLPCAAGPAAAACRLAPGSGLHEAPVQGALAVTLSECVRCAMEKARGHSGLRGRGTRGSSLVPTAVWPWVTTWRCRVSAAQSPSALAARPRQQHSRCLLSKTSLEVGWLEPHGAASTGCVYTGDGGGGGWP